jgi:hypothetical protein
MKLVYDHLPTKTMKSKTGGQSWLPCICQHCNIHPETFDHLLQCNHEHGEKFRKEITKAILTLCKKKSIPTNFQTTLIDILHDWFQGIPPLELSMNTPAVNALLHAQRKIGWSRFLRGFLSRQWSRYLEYEQNHAPKPPPENFNSDDFFRNLIKTLWEHQSSFWKEYQHTLHQTTLDQDSPTRDSLFHEIRHLYTLRNAVAIAHRNEYFPMNLNQFLKNSSTVQLQNYVLNYKQPILHSIKMEQQKPDRTRRIWSFCGFTRLRATVPQHHSTTTGDVGSIPTPAPLPLLPPTHTASLPTRPTNPPHRHNNPHTQESIPHKHSRWKKLHEIQDRFRAFFTL